MTKQEETFEALCHDLGESDDVSRRALEQLREGRISLLAVNGWIASGKDTVAPEALRIAGREGAAHLSFAGAVRDELDEIVSVLQRSADPDAAAAEVARSQQVPLVQAGVVTGLLWVEARDENPITSRSRTRSTRAAMQYWGTTVRRGEDPDYWVKIALSKAVGHVAEGRSVYFTDVRFENEALWLRRAGFLLVRLAISRATQAERLHARDGLAPSPSVLLHESETALEGLDVFDAVISNEGAAREAAERIAGLLRGASA